MGPLGWDTHAQNFSTIKNTLAPPLDKGVAALVEDLGERGLLDDTLVVMMGEFGRTPKINGNAGRDHHGRANSVLMFGAGTPAGLVIGRTDPTGDAPVDRPVTPADLAWVLYHKLGIDPMTTRFEAPDGRPIRLVDGANPPRELI
jgi:arylsulfatase A-like enzyme